MPLFFFHLRTTQGLDADDTGTLFPDLDTAYLDVCRAIPEMVEGLLRGGRDPMRCAFEITDEGGRSLMEVPFAERLTKTVPRPGAAVDRAATGPAACDDIDLRSASAVAESQDVRRRVQQSREEVAWLARVRSRSGVAALIHHLETMGWTGRRPA